MLISTTDTIRESFNLCKKNWRILAPYVGFLLLPWFIKFLVGYVGVKIDVWANSQLPLVDLINWVVFVAGSLFSLLSAIVLNRVLKALLKNEPLPDKKTLFITSLKFFWPIIYTGMIVSLAIFVGTLLFVVPGVIFFIWFVFTSLVIIFENKKGLGAMLVSKQLVVGRWWSVFVRLITGMLCFIIIAAIIQSIIMFVIKFLPVSLLTVNILDTALADIFSILTTPLLLSVLTIVYYSLKENPNSPPPSSAPPVITP